MKLDAQVLHVIQILHHNNFYSPLVIRNGINQFDEKNGLSVIGR